MILKNILKLILEGSMTNYTPEIKKIIVPVSIGNEDIVALKQALIFQEIYGCEIILLNVLTKVSVFHKIMRPKNLKKQIKKAEKSLRKFTTIFFGGEMPSNIKLKITTGNLIEKILITAERTNCDLIIIKKRRRILTKFSFLKNENADKLISGALCPVLTIPKKNIENTIKNILIPVDITKKIDIKIAWVKYLALKFNAKVNVVSVLDLNIAPLKSLAYQKALLIEESMKEVGLEANVELLKANNQSMHDVILSHIGKLNPDLVLIMTHQESILFDNYIGKFATEVIHRSNSPIFSLVPRKETLITSFIDSLDSQNKIMTDISRKITHKVTQIGK
ncbi:MAG: universal stress protein [Bacteroidales bacterium]|nr:universal stress protein [Bacteroidales bacterium]